MIGFTQLYTELDSSNSTNAKIRAMVAYFKQADASDAAWATYFLTGRRLKRLIKRNELRAWTLTATGIPEWLLEETYQHVGDMAETIALLVPNSALGESLPLTLREWVEGRLLRLTDSSDQQREEQVLSWWKELPADACFTLNKLMTGALRVGVSQKLVQRALAEFFEVDAKVVAHRMMGSWEPSAEWFDGLGDPDAPGVTTSTPYPFFLASPLDGDPMELGAVADWRVEWKWDGIRAQIIRREGQTFIWSRGEELLEGRFPELEEAASHLSDGTVLDGEILAWRDGAPLPFSELQRRIGKLNPGPKLVASAPVVLLAYDILEFEGTDLRGEPLDARRDMLEGLLSQPVLLSDKDRCDSGNGPRFTESSEILKNDAPLLCSPQVGAKSWEDLARLREESRERGVEGFILKRASSAYRVGRQRGDWWKWKVDALTLDAVLIYAQPGSGRRSNLLTDYTFAVWKGEAGNSELLPVCKAYSGLSNDEIAELDRWLRNNTRERFGPVRSVKPEHVFEIAFEGIAWSKRHKSGVALRFPRIHRWRKDLASRDADTIDTVKDLIVAAN
ncbi:MAG: ATP-dependent DNA ligase [Pseudomonadota bacterium]